jgi:hypothetical protein
MPISVGIAPPSSTLSVSSVCSLSTTPPSKGRWGRRKEEVRAAQETNGRNRFRIGGAGDEGKNRM